MRHVTEADPVVLTGKAAWPTQPYVEYRYAEVVAPSRLDTEAQRVMGATPAHLIS